MLDKQNTFSDGQAILGGANTYVCTNKINTQGGSGGAGGSPAFTTDTLGNTLDNDKAKSPAVDILITVTEQFVGGDTVSFQAGYDADSAFGSPTILAQTPALAVAVLKPGYQVRLALAPGQTASEIYMGTQYVTLGAGAMTAGKVTASIVQRGGRPTAPGVFV